MRKSPSLPAELRRSVDAHKSKLLEDGYCIIRNGLSSEVVPDLFSKINAIIDKRKLLRSAPSVGANGYYTDLQNDDLTFIRVVFGHPILRALLISSLNDPYYRGVPSGEPNYIFRGIRVRDAVSDGLPLHIDSVLPSSSRHPTGIVSAFILEDHERSNGCTLVVPGTHRSDEFADRSAVNRAVALEAKAGDIVLWDTRLWHGTEDNPQRRSRLSLLCTFTSWHLKQPYRHYETLPDSIYRELTDEEKTIIGFRSVPAKDSLDATHEIDEVDELPSSRRAD